MASDSRNRAPTVSELHRPASHWWPPVVALVAVAGHLPVLGAWWHHDDWELLAGAAGLARVAGGPARWFSRHLYWRLLFPAAGLDPQPWAASRLLLFGLAAALVVIVARRLRWGPAVALAAGLLLALSPLAFTPLHWAAGVQELLGLTLGLLAVERCLAGGWPSLVAAGVAGAGAILAKENTLLLPAVLWILPARHTTHRRGIRAVALLLVPLSLLEAWWVWQGFDHGPAGLFALDAGAIPVNLAQYGWWLASPGPIPYRRFSFAVGLAGLAVWILWAAWARWRWLEDDRRSAGLLAVALFTLLPVLPLRTRVQPYLALAAAVPAAITLAAALVPYFLPMRRPRWRVVGPTLLAVAAVSWLGTSWRITRRDSAGLPRDPEVRGAAVSRSAAATLQAVPPLRAPVIALLQPRFRRHTSPALPLPTPLYEALGGPWGPRLLAHRGQQIQWFTELGKIPPEAVVFADGRTRLLFWGSRDQARLYWCLDAIAHDRPLAAASVLRRAMREGRRGALPFLFDPLQLPVPVDGVRRHAAAFLAVLAAESLPATEREAMLETARQMLAASGALPAPAARDTTRGWTAARQDTTRE